MEEVKSKLRDLWKKVIENKAVVIPVGTAIAGALIGAAVTSVILKSYEGIEIPKFEDLVNDN